MIPTVGFNMRKVTKGNVTIKVGRPSKVSSWMLSLFKWNQCIRCISTCLELYSPGLSCTAVLLMTVFCSLASDMGHRWTAPLQKHVGALLQRSQRYCVSLWTAGGLSDHKFTIGFLSSLETWKTDWKLNIQIENNVYSVCLCLAWYLSHIIV